MVPYSFVSFSMLLIFYVSNFLSSLYIYVVFVCHQSFPWKPEFSNPFSKDGLYKISVILSFISTKANVHCFINQRAYVFMFLPKRSNVLFVNRTRRPNKVILRFLIACESFLFCTHNSLFRPFLHSFPVFFGLEIFLSAFIQFSLIPLNSPYRLELNTVLYIL